MITRFLLLWLLIALVILVVRFVSPPEKRADIALWVKRFLISAVLAAAILAALMSINNISGV
jgi:hypothetical protein